MFISKKLIKKLINKDTILAIILVSMLIWLFASFLNINSHNLGDMNYASWNILAIIFMR